MFEIWYFKYETHLFNLYNITINRLKNNKIDTDITFEKFCIFVYNNSSGYISNY